MLDIRVLRVDAERFKAALVTKGVARGQIDEVVELDARARELKREAEELKAQRNAASKRIGRSVQAGEQADQAMSAVRELGDRIRGLDAEAAVVEEDLRERLLILPNLPHPSVPVGPDETANREVRREGEPRRFAFSFKAHWDLGTDLDILDFERAGKVAGSRFTFYKGLGAKLERAVINFMLDVHTGKGYTEIFPPFMVNSSSATGTGQLPKLKEDMFEVQPKGFYLIPTAEVPVTNLHREEILPGERLPLRYAAYSACFRAEAGAAGRDTRGLIRQHQFNKVELVKFVRPEDSYAELDSLVEDASDILRRLALPFRVVALATGDLSFASAKTYDLEVWLPSYNGYKEISSCSNFEDFQARRAEIRFRPAEGAKVEYVHTLNGSGLAVGRTVAAVMENYQNEDGSITVPAALRPFMGVDRIG